jgi:hypothetical protein
MRAIHRFSFLSPVAALLLWSVTAFAQLTPGTDVNSSQKSGDDNECAVSANPANPNQVFVACNTTGPGLFAARSTDGGVTWTFPDPSDKTIADGDAGQGLAAWCDPTLAWDTFGNLYVTYINAAGTGIQTILSTDGGATFTDLATFSGSVDQPTVVAANTSATTAAVWVVWNQSGQMVARGAPVTGSGAGSIGAFTALQTIPGTSNCSFGDIAVSPSGVVVQVCGSPTGGEGPSSLLVNTDGDGLGGGGFAPAVVATTTNVGGFDFFPAQNARSVDPEAGLAYDNHTGSPHLGRLYLVYTEETAPENDDLDIMLRFSDNDGATWSSAMRVNDDAAAPIRSQFLPKIAVDDTTGNVLVCWHDARNSGTNTAMQEFCAMATPAGATPTFAANVLVSDGPSTSNGSGVEFGDYSGLDFVQNMAHPVWADTSNSTLNNPDVNARFDAALDRVSSAPASPPMAQRFFSIHGGIAHPHGTLASVTNQGWTLNLDYIRAINTHWAWDFRLGYARFPGQTISPDVDVWMLLANLRYTINPAAGIRTFVNGGLGGYAFDPGDVEGGANLGIGLNKPINPNVQLELTYNYHWAFTASPALRFSQVQAGVLFRF